MNESISLLKNHRSVRDFDSEYQLDEEILKDILDVSRQAPSWMNGQSYSIIVIDDKEIQNDLAERIGKNPQIATCSVFLLFLLDMRRMEVAAQLNGAAFAVQGDLDSLLVTATDATLAMQNAAIAAEALGLATVYIGSVRKITAHLIERFCLPEYVFPFCGLCIGRATVAMPVKPRLPERCVVFRNQYSDENFRESIHEYDEIMERFAEARETKRWSVKFADYHSQNINSDTLAMLRKQKFIETDYCYTPPEREGV